MGFHYSIWIADEGCVQRPTLSQMTDLIRDLPLSQHRRIWSSDRISNLDVDFYIPQSKGLIIIEDDDFMHKVYEDISMAARFSGYKVQIIPVKYIESDENLSVYLGDVLVPVPQSEGQ